MKKKKTYLVIVVSRISEKTMHKKTVEGYRLARAAFPDYRANRNYAVHVLPQQ